MSTAGVVAVQSNPFPGLRPFHENEEHLFFGRESQVDAMVDTLAASRFLAVVGTSGSGKSSLVNCGLRPALRGGLMARAGTAWRMAQFRPGSDPLQAMARALAEDDVLFRDHQAGGLALDEIIETTLRMSKLGLIDIYEQAQLDEDVNLLVVVDQFEELFRYARLGDQQETVHGVSEEAVAFVNLLLAAKDQATCPIYVVLTMRSDFLGDCAQFPGLAEAINAGQYLVPRMTRDERRAAISGPVGVGGAEMSPVLLTRLVNDVGNNPDQLSILQHALNRTWARWENQDGREGPLDLAHYQAIGTMAHALDQHAERAYAELASERQRQICEKLFKALTDKATDPRGVRRPTTLGTVCALAEATEAEVTEVIDVFRKPSRSFLMPPAGEALEAETVIDISHESLMRVWQRLNAWADEEARSAQIYRRLAESSVLHRDGDAALFQDPDLQVALGWRERNQPNDVWARRYHPEFETAMRFLNDSVAERERVKKEEEAERQHELTLARKNAWRWRAFSAFSLLLVAIAVFFFFEQRRARSRANSLADDANRLAEEANLRKKAALVNALLPREPLKALVLAIQTAGQKSTLREVESSLRSAVQASSWSNVFQAHQGFTTIAITPDGNTIVSGGDDGAVRLWNRASGEAIGELSGHEGLVTSVAITPDGKTIVSGGEDGVVRLWSRESGEAIRELTTDGPWVTSVAIAADGNTIVSGGGDGTVQWWNAASGETIGQVGHDDWVTSVAIAPDGKAIISGSADWTVRLWDIESGVKLEDWTAGEAWVTSVAVAPDGRTIVSGGEDGTVRLWDRESGGVIGELRGHEGWVTSIAIAPDGNTIVSGGEDGTVRLWDRESAGALGELRGRAESVTAVAIAPDGRTIFSGSDDGTLWSWDLENDTMGKSLAWHGEGEGAPISLAISPGDTIVGGGKEGTLRLWTRDGRSIAELTGHDASIEAVAITPDGKTIVSGGDDGIVRLWDRESGEAFADLRDLTGNEEPVSSVGITPDGKAIVSGGYDGTVRVWRREGKPGGELLKRESDYLRVTSLAISSDGKTIVSGSDDGSVRLYSGTKKKILEEGGGRVSATPVAISPDGRTIVSGSGDGKLRLWNREDGGGTRKRTLRGNKGVTSVAFSPDGRTIVSGSDTTVRLWDRGGNPIGSFFRRKADARSTTDADVNVVGFSADAREIVMVSGNDRKVWLWPVGDPKAWLQQACRRVRNHGVLVEPDDEVAREIAEEVVEDGGETVENAAEICLNSDAWSEEQKIGFLVRRGRGLARRDVGKAIAAFREARELDPEVDLDGDPDTIDQDVEAVARDLAALAASAKVEEGYLQAQEGDLEKAIAAFQKAKELDPRVDLDPDTTAIDEDPEAVASKLAAPARVWEGHQRAQDGDVEKAIAALREARELDPGIDLDGDPETTDRDLEDVAKRLAASSKVWEGSQWAQEGDVEKAVADFRAALALDPRVDLDPDTTAIEQDPEAAAKAWEGRRLAQEKVWEGDQLAEEGDIEKALQAYAEAEELDPSLATDASFWNNVGWVGSLGGNAANALIASEKAVALATEDHVGDCRDTRGLARALTGDTQGAIEDFEAFIGSDPLPELKAQRQQWVDALRGGEEPFTPQLLAELRNQ